MDLEKPWEEKVTEAGRPRSTLDVRGKRLGFWANISDNEICSERNQSIYGIEEAVCDVDCIGPSDPRQDLGPRSRARALRWPIGCVPRPAACGGVLCSRVASHATQMR